MRSGKPPKRADFGGILALHHVQVFYRAGEGAVARRFYRDQLGLTEIPRPSTLVDRDGMWFALGDSHLHLSADPDLALHPRRHFGVRVADLDAVVARLGAAGARSADADPIPGWRRVYVFDPFGNKIELDKIG